MLLLATQARPVVDGGFDSCALRGDGFSQFHQRLEARVDWPTEGSHATDLINFGEAYPLHGGDRFLLTFDNHNSVNGIREFARARGA